MDFKEGQPPQRCLFENWERKRKEKEIIIEVQSDIECSLPLFLRLSCSGLVGGSREGVFLGWEKESFWVCENTHTCTHTHTKHFPVKMFSLPTSQNLCYGYIWFSFNLCCPPHASVSHPSIVLLRLFSSLSPHSATKASCQSFFSSPLTIVSISFFSIPSTHSYFKPLFFFFLLIFHSLPVIIPVSFVCHLLLLCFKHALCLYLSSRSFLASSFFPSFFPFLPPFWLFHSPSLFFMLSSPVWASCYLFKQLFKKYFLFIVNPWVKVHLGKEGTSADFSGSARVLKLVWLFLFFQKLNFWRLWLQTELFTY